MKTDIKEMMAVTPREEALVTFWYKKGFAEGEILNRPTRILEAARKVLVARVPALNFDLENHPDMQELSNAFDALIIKPSRAKDYKEEYAEAIHNVAYPEKSL